MDKLRTRDLLAELRLDEFRRSRKTPVSVPVALRKMVAHFLELGVSLGSGSILVTRGRATTWSRRGKQSAADPAVY